AIHAERFMDAGVQGIRITLSGGLWKLAYVWYGWQLSLVRKGMRMMGLRLDDFDIVHSNVVHPAGVIGDRLTHGKHIPHVITEHWTRLEQYFTKDLLRGQGLRAYRRAAMIFPVSKYLAAVVARFAGPHEGIHVVPNVVPGTAFHWRPRKEHPKVRL